MNIIIINYYYPPMVGAHAYRWGQIAKQWAAEGHKVTVLTSKCIDQPEQEISDGVTIIRVGLFTKGIDGNSSSTSAHVGRRGIVKSKIISIFKKFYRFFYWPDGLWHWLPFAVAALVRLRKSEFEMVVSYSPTFSAHLAAHSLNWIAPSSKRRWVLDYGDPFSISETMQPNNFLLFRKINFLAEKRLLSAASSVVFTNYETCMAYKSAFGNSTTFSIIPHLVDINLFHAGNTSCSSNKISKDINLVYVGGFHKGIREPDVMLEFFSKLSMFTPIKFSLNIYGPSNGFDLSHCKPPIYYHGSVSRARAIDLIRQADCLVNVDNVNCVMVPSKVVEYIATGHPVVNFRGDKDMSDIMLKYAESGMVVEVGQNFSSNELEAVASFVEKKSDVVTPVELVSDVLSENKLSSVSSRYLGTVE